MFAFTADTVQPAFVAPLFNMFVLRHYYERADVGNGKALAEMAGASTILARHTNIVMLHRSLETRSFLLLVLEFVPGQDLYYFLEQARDHYEPDPPSGRQSLDREREGGCEKEANTSVLSVCTVGTRATTRTPPTPSLLS